MNNLWKKLGGHVPGVYAVDMSPQLFPEVVHGTDANPVSFFGRGGGI